MKRNIAFTALCIVLFCCASMAQADVLTSEYQDYSFNVSDKFLHGTSGFHGDVNNDGDEEFVTAKMAYAVDEQLSTFPVYIYDKNGNVTDIQARGPHARLEKEAVRVVEKIPQMTPGKQRNRPVGVKYTLPITLVVE